MSIINHFYALLITIPLALACQPTTTLPLQHHRGLFDYYAQETDKPTVLAMAGLMDSVFVGLCENLGVEYKQRVKVEVYPAQADFDGQVMNASMKGRPAVSGSYRIQMVSPNSPIAVSGIPYRERLWFVVHEFVHLAIDEVSADMPEWLDEGVACYEGSYAVYAYVCRHGLPPDAAPTVSELITSYDSIPAAEVYVFSLVDYIVARFGRDKLRQLLRNPHHIESVLGVELSELAAGWKEFMMSQYQQKE